MRFFVGIHDPHQAFDFAECFISVNRLWKRKSDFAVGEWILDSGAFTELDKHGCYREERSVANYAAQIRRWKRCGHLLAAVAQDYMCEPIMLEKTGLSVAEHQRLTVERYDALMAEETGVTILPVLQGFKPRDYAAHIEQYGERLASGAWVGVGSVCKRQGSPFVIMQVLMAIRRVRPDLRLHGFGVKLTSLADGDVRAALYSADSMAWSYSARMQGRSADDPREAHDFIAKIERQQPIPTLLSWM
ncbi:MAG: hypothetical protein KY445_00920 [Armatimonadetes bacterium]|nr:hypothetical protein [Armatimonadota bacterium]